MSMPVMLVGAKGVVTNANGSAEALFGPVSVGRSCCDVVRARDGGDAPVCNSGCAAAMLREGARERDHRQVRVRGRWSRLVCSPMGNQLVVTVLPDEPKAAEASVLTPREHEVLELVAQGLTSAQIARRLGIRPATVRTHVEHAREKLGAHTRAEAVARALGIGSRV
jgi:DNA-binding CsgD family transcriptional regulator